MTYHQKLTSWAARCPGKAALSLALLVILIIVLTVKVKEARARLEECRRVLHMRDLVARHSERFREPRMQAQDAPKQKNGGEFDWTKPACDMTWDPSAVAESQALVEMGSIGVDNYGDRRLQKAATSRDGPTNQQLIQLMKHGIAP